MLKRTVTVCAVFLFQLTVFSQILPEKEFSGIYNYCQRLFSSIGLDKNLSSNIFRELTPQTVVLEPKFQMQKESVIIQTSKMFLRLDYKTRRLAVLNFDLDDEINKIPVRTPGLSVTEAIEKGKSYLKKLDLTLHQDMILKKVQFNKDHPSCWEVRWGPNYGGYEYDDFVASYEQSMVVIFHEKIGFRGFATKASFPSPKNTVVKLSKEDAVRRAEKAAPLVMRTPYYQMCRVQGFKVSGLDKAELLVSAPNWLLDPERAVWIREKIPEESRLCWVVTLLTVDTVKRKDGMKPIPPKIVVYVDAATGEIVGANFT